MLTIQHYIGFLAIFYGSEEFEFCSAVFQVAKAQLRWMIYSSVHYFFGKNDFIARVKYPMTSIGY
jgi:hypothetical protein